MNERLGGCIEAQVAPGHECTLYTGGCHMPHYWHSHSVPRYIDQWPEPTPACALADEIRDERDWASAE
ncbi:MAG: hypothetical protein EXR68_07675 [Dehalococcoidia bacterium]|nr:hypothetical protein [Dehalococcoidia bacterium]